jgi:hypothetical protein
MPRRRRGLAVKRNRSEVVVVAGADDDLDPGSRLPGETLKELLLLLLT